MNQVAGNQMRLYDLPSKLLCRVINVELKVLAALPLSLSFSRPLLEPNFAPRLRIFSSPAVCAAPKFRFRLADLFRGILPGGGGHRRGLRAGHAYARDRTKYRFRGQVELYNRHRAGEAGRTILLQDADCL
jgi:hypothetical protein